MQSSWHDKQSHETSNKAPSSCTFSQFHLALASHVVKCTPPGMEVGEYIQSLRPFINKNTSEHSNTSSISTPTVQPREFEFDAPAYYKNLYQTSRKKCDHLKERVAELEHDLRAKPTSKPKTAVEKTNKRTKRSKGIVAWETVVAGDIDGVRVAGGEGQVFLRQIFLLTRLLRKQIDDIHAEELTRAVCTTASAASKVISSFYNTLTRKKLDQGGTFSAAIAKGIVFLLLGLELLSLKASGCKKIGERKKHSHVDVAIYGILSLFKSTLKLLRQRSQLSVLVPASISDLKTNQGKSAKFSTKNGSTEEIGTSATCLHAQSISQILHILFAFIPTPMTSQAFDKIAKSSNLPVKSDSASHILLEGTIALLFARAGELLYHLTFKHKRAHLPEDNIRKGGASESDFESVMQDLAISRFEAKALSPLITRAVSSFEQLSELRLCTVGNAEANLKESSHSRLRHMLVTAIFDDDHGDAGVHVRLRDLLGNPPATTHEEFLNIYNDLMDGESAGATRTGSQKRNANVNNQRGGDVNVEASHEFEETEEFVEKMWQIVGWEVLALEGMECHNLVQEAAV